MMARSSTMYFMFIFSTILYLEENPTGYDVYKEGEYFSFKRAIDTQSEILPALIEVTRTGNEWKLSGADIPEIKEQIIRIIDMNEKIELTGDLSAAS